MYRRRVLVASLSEETNNMNHQYMQWIKIIDKFVLGEHDKSSCPNCGSKIIKVIYIGDRKTRKGYSQAWCEDCEEGIYCCNVLLPERVEIISFEDNDKIKSIPNYKMIMSV